ncbi:Accessory gene regulator B [Clostridium sp. DL-VIII]|uniref:accessory gene regulator ArgB-like protein n=1 Tax=Clostridium sp. DL-VIII TaxID=641107 RepID=UPI00023AF090|nr:accessory gene regulator B family protein [Clostridium sp. DL-VIII]EHI98140.1 Accessory gene regulator B [Clostridium sp. DL-VIII]
MSLTEKMAVKIGKNAKSVLNIDNDTEEIIIYGAINLIQIISAFTCVIIAGLIFGVLCEALIFTISVSILRKYSGGAHASSPLRCTIIGMFLALAVGLSVDKILYKFNITTVILMSIACVIFTLLVILRNAPVDSIQKPITDIKMREAFRKKSIIVIFICSFVIIGLFVINMTDLEVYNIKLIETISIGLFWQAITLTKKGISLLNKFDFILKNRINMGGE